MKAYTIFIIMSLLCLHQTIAQDNDNGDDRHSQSSSMADSTESENNKDGKTTSSSSSSESDDDEEISVREILRDFVLDRADRFKARFKKITDLRERIENILSGEK